jgi:hypothetical protein
MNQAGRIQQWSQRLNLRLLILVLALGLGLNLVGVGHLLVAFHWMLSPADLQLLVQLGSLLVMVLIAAAGIYSLVSEFAFWEGWLQGLPAPASLFEPAAAGRAPYRCYLVYLDGIHQLERDHPPRVSNFLALLEQHLP